MCDATIELLKEYKKWQDEYILKMGNKWKGSNRVFTSSNGEYMYPDTCSKIVLRLVKKYNLPKLTFYELRHTSASVMVEKGMNAKAVSQRLGHSNTNITDIYTHTFDETKLKCANIFNEIIKNS